MSGVDNFGSATGVTIIETALETMPGNPGVYRMLDAKGDALYVGKARNLKKRVTSYTQLSRLPERLRRMVADTASMEILTTHTEAEALLLEANLIKRLKPRYNILLRDDKSYPWLMLTEDHPFPQIAKHRGAQTARAAIGGRSPRPGRSTRRCRLCSAFFSCAPARTRYLPTAPGPACYSRSNAAPRPASAASARLTIQRW